MAYGGLTPDTREKHPMGRVEAGAFFGCPGDNMQPGFRISALEKNKGRQHHAAFREQLDRMVTPYCSSHSHQISMRRERRLALQLAEHSDCFKL